MTAVECRGNELSLDDCPHDDSNKHRCHYSASIICQGLKSDSLDDVEVSVLTETSTIPCASHEGPNSIELQLTCENPTKGEAVRISPTKADKRLIICEVEVNVEFPVAYRKPALQSSTLSANVASRSTDGVHDGPLRHSCSQTMFSHQPWWSVDLQSVYYVRGVKIYSGFKMDNFKVSVSGRRCFRYIGTEIPSYFSRDCNSPRKGQLVTIQVQSTRKHSLRICEVDVITITGSAKATMEPFTLTNLGSDARITCTANVNDKEGIQTVKILKEGKAVMVRDSSGHRNVFGNKRLKAYGIGLTETLVVKGVTRIDDGTEYSCRVTSTLGIEAWSSTIIIVNDMFRGIKREVAEMPPITFGYLSEDTLVNCTVKLETSRDERLAQIQYSREGRTVVNYSAADVLLPGYDDRYDIKHHGTMYSLVVKNTATSDQGVRFSCRVATSIGYGEAETTFSIGELPKMPKLSINPVAHARYLTLGTLVIVECEASVGLPRSQNTSVTIVVMKSSAAEQILVGPEHSRLVDDKTSTFNNTIDFNVDYSYNGAIFRCIASNAASPPRVTIANTIRYEITVLKITDPRHCFKSATGCKNGAWCTMETGLCSCLQGYQGKSCTEDINECKLVPYPCHVNATCHNAIGSFKCRCKKGQVGNGQFCREENIKDKLKWLIPLVLLNIFFIPFIIGTFVFLRRKIRAKAKKKTTGTKTINRDYRYSILTAYRRPDPNAKILPDADTLRRSEECNNEQNKDKDDDDDDYDDDDN